MKTIDNFLLFKSFAFTLFTSLDTTTRFILAGLDSTAAWQQTSLLLVKQTTLHSHYISNKLLANCETKYTQRRSLRSSLACSHFPCNVRPSDYVITLTFWSISFLFCLTNYLVPSFFSPVPTYTVFL